MLPQPFFNFPRRFLDRDSEEKGKGEGCVLCLKTETVKSKELNFNLWRMLWETFRKTNRKILWSREKRNMSYDSGRNLFTAQNQTIYQLETNAIVLATTDSPKISQSEVVFNLKFT